MRVAVRETAARIALDAVLVTRLGIALYAAVTAFYLAFGTVNNDEGWYLYAARQFVQGLLPYRDLVYPQMPLLGYIYGVPQVVLPGLLTGRLVSILISAGLLAASLAIAKRYAGWQGSAITVILMACFTWAIYFNTIVKTYALVSFAFAATLLILSSDLNENVKYPLAVLMSLVAALARVTAFAFVAPIFLYVLYLAPWRGRILILLETAVTGALAAYWLLPDWSVASWNLFGSHLRHWGGAGLIDQLWQILYWRLPDLAQNLAPVVMLSAVSAYLLWILRRSARRRLEPVWVVGAGLVLFAASHFANGIWTLEYLVPAAAAGIPIIGIGLALAYRRGDAVARGLVVAAVVTAAALLPLGESAQRLSWRGGKLPIQQYQEAAAVVASNTTPADRVLALDAFAAVVEANRTALEGYTLAQFSLQDVDAPTANTLHVANYTQTLAVVRNKAARVILLTDADWDMLDQANPPTADDMRQALMDNYRPIYETTEFGQFSQTLVIYLAR